jgi:hypothetical protein
VLQWSNPPEWTNEHAAKLQTFMGSEVGVQLKYHLRNLHIQNCDRLISSPADLAYHAGHAAGFKSALATLDGMASIVSQPDEPVVGVTDDLEWMRQSA